MMQKVKVVQDEDCHWYIIPENLYKEFVKSINDPDSDYEEFERVFGKYMTGGDINLVQLWAEI